MRRLAAIISIVALVAGVEVSVRADEPWAAREAVILARVLAYDRNLEARVGPAVTIAILRKPSGNHTDAMRRVYQSFQALEKLTIRGLPLSVVELEYRGAEELDASIKKLNIDTLYLGPALEGDLETILRVTRERRVLTMASESNYVFKGAAVGVFEENGKPRIHVNLPASRREGVALLPELLRLAEVIR